MRIIAVSLLLASTVHAKPLASELDEWLAQRYLIALDQRVDVGPLAFSDATCSLKFGRGTVVTDDAARQALADCLYGEGRSGWYRLRENHYVLVTDLGQAIELATRRGSIHSIGPVGGAPLPTFDRLGVQSGFVPGVATRREIDNSDAGAAEVVFALCHDDAGKITKRRPIRRSNSRAFDRDAEAYVAKLASLDSSAGLREACDLVYLRYPQLDLDPSSIAPDPNPAAWMIMSPDELHAHMTAGSWKIEPIEVTKTEIRRSGLERIAGTFQVCVDTEGAPTHQLVESTRFEGFDRTITEAMNSWRFKPFERGGHPIIACAKVTVVYVPH